MDSHMKEDPACVTSTDPSYPENGIGIQNPGNRLSALRGARLPWPVALYLFCVLLPIGFNVGPLVITTLRLTLLIVTVPLMIRILSGRYGRVMSPDIMFSVHMMWIALALAVNSPAQVVTQVGSVGVEFLGGYAIGRAYIRTPEAFTALCRWLVAIVLVTLPLALMESLTGHPILIESLRALPGIWTVPNVNNTPRLGLERAQVMMAHPIHYGLLCSVAMSLAFIALKGVTSESWRYLSSFLVGFAGFLALSSGAILAIALQVGLFIWSALFAQVQWRWWMLLGFVTVSYVVVDVLSDRTPLVVFVHYLTYSAHNAYWRMLIFEWGMINIYDNPIFGLGLNDWVRPQFMHSSSMDNFWLVIAVRYGIPALLLLAIGYAFPYLRIVFRNFSSDPGVNQLRLAWAFTFAGITFTLFTVHIWANMYSFIFFVFGAGMWLVTYQPRSDSDAEQDVPHVPEKQPAFSRFPDGREPSAPKGGSELVLSRAEQLGVESVVKTGTRHANQVGPTPGFHRDP